MEAHDFILVFERAVLQPGRFLSAIRTALNSNYKYITKEGF
jgi:hypothetical protein